MLFGVFAFMLLVITSWVVYVHRPKKPGQEKNLSRMEGMRFIIPLRERISIDNGKFGQHSIDLWGEENALFCVQLERLKQLTSTKSALSITDFTHWAVFKLLDAPLDRQQVERIINVPDTLTPVQQAALRTHKAALVIEMLSGTSDRVACAQFAVKALKTVLQYDEALGCVVEAHGGYWPKEAIDQYQRADDMKTLLLLLTRTELFLAADGFSYLTHLHGMEQFGLPDLRVKFFNWEDAEYYRALVERCALYALRDGQVMEAGEIAELIGDGVIYRINEVTQQERSHFGRYGALALVRISNATSLIVLN